MEHTSDVVEQTLDSNYFEELVDKMVLDQIPGITPEFVDVINGLPTSQKRMAILSILDKDLNLFRKIKALTDQRINKMEHIKDIILMLRDYVKVGKVEKKKFGEVMTPLELVKEMLATLPEEVWSNPNLKWLDPANGTGPYPIMVIYKLMNGLKEWEPDDEKRYKHIVENMIYVCELQPKNMFLYLCAIDPFDKYSLNIYTGSFLESGFDKHMKVVWGVDKFDIVVGNPPYQEVSENGKTKTGGANLYTKFIRKSFDINLNKNGHLLFITPPTWMNTGSNELDIFSKNQIIYLNIEECGKYFNVGSKFSYFNIKKDIIKNKTDVVCKYGDNVYKSQILLSNFIYLPMLLVDKTINIYDKLNKNKKINFNILFKFDHRRDFISKNEDDIFKYKLKHTSKQYRYSSLIHPSQNVKKVLFSRSGKLTPEYDDGVLGTTDGIMWVNVDNREQGSNLINIFNSKLFRFILDVYKWNGFNDVTILKNLPQLDLSKSWTDQELYEYFQLTQEEIDLIEKTIKD